MCTVWHIEFLLRIKKKKTKKRMTNDQAPQDEHKSHISKYNEYISFTFRIYLYRIQYPILVSILQSKLLLTF